MPYSAATVAETVDMINRRLFLPAIQRPFVWESQQIIRLFDSLMKGFPISSFLFWNIASENKRHWQIYKFTENFRFGEVHHDKAGVDGLDVRVVLDGQQRLTALLISLRGSITEKTKGKRWNNSDAWTTKTLFLNLLFEPSPDVDVEEDEVEQLYAFSFFGPEPQSSPGQLWIKVGDILECGGDEQLTAFKLKMLRRLPESTSAEEKGRVERNIDKLHSAVWRDQTICFYTEERQDYDRVLRIFVRANDAGTKLSKSDLMLAVVASKWTGISAKEEVTNLENELNNRSRDGNNITRDYIIKATLLLSGLDHRYRVSNLTGANLDRMLSEWPAVKSSLRRTFALLNAFGINGGNLTSLNATLPVALYLHRSKVDLLSAETQFHVQNSERVRRWIIASLLNRVFGGSSDSTIAVAANCMAHIRPGDDFPFLQLGDALTRHLRRPATMTPEAIDDAINFEYCNKLTFLLLTLLYDEQRWGQMQYHVDHIFPESRLTRSVLMASHIPYSEVERIRAAANRIGNLELLTATDNLEKSNQPFEAWISSRDRSFLKRHHIPDNEHLWSIRMLPDFVATREKVIRQRLAALQGDPT